MQMAEKAVRGNAAGALKHGLSGRRSGRARTFLPMGNTADAEPALGPESAKKVKGQHPGERSPEESKPVY